MMIAIGAAILLIAGSAGAILYTTVIQPARLHAQASATGQSISTATALTHATSSAQASAAMHAAIDATGTAVAQVTATATALQSLYTQATSGTPAIDDAMIQQDLNQWEVDNKTGGGSCAEVAFSKIQVWQL